MYSLIDNRNSLYIAGIEEDSIVDGPGLRFVLFLQGCVHRCQGCHNPESWDFSEETLKSKEMSFSDIVNKIKSNGLCSGITLSGGEPVLQSRKLSKFIDYLKANNTNKPIMMFTGYTLGQLKVMAYKDLYLNNLLLSIDSIMDGPYIQEQKSLELKFRGSLNQRYWIKDASGKFISGD